MIAALRNLASRFDGIPERRLLWINIGLACLVSLAHGGALAITLSKPAPNAEAIRQLASVSLPIAGLLIVTAVVALLRAEYRSTVLAIHGLAFGVGALASLWWALTLLASGIPEGNFRWSVGLLTASVAYAAFLVCRFTMPSPMRGRPAIRYAPLVATVIAAAIDISVFLRLVTEIGAQIAK
jgi:hypothetical protein